MDVLADEPQETRELLFFFFLYTVGMCKIYPGKTFFSVFASVIFVLLKRTLRWTKPELVLFDIFSAVFLFIGVLF